MLNIMANLSRTVLDAMISSGGLSTKVLGATAYFCLMADANLVHALSRRVHEVSANLHMLLSQDTQQTLFSGGKSISSSIGHAG